MSSYRENLLEFNAKYRNAVSEGKTQPFLVPRDLAGLLLLFIWLMLTPHHTKLPSIFRPAIFTVVVALSILTLLNRRSLGLAFGLGVGALSMITVVLAINFMLLHDPRQFSRLVLQHRAGAKVPAQPRIEGMPGANLKAKKCDFKKRQFAHDYYFVWQKAPDNVFTRAYWVLDLLISLRGSHWLWTNKDTSQHQYTTPILVKLPRKAHSIIYTTFMLVISYMSLDCIKMAMIYDPYFWGEIQAGPPHYLPSLLKAQVPLQLYRILITVLGILSAIIYLSTIGHMVAFIILGSSGYGFFGGDWHYMPPNGSIQAIARHGLKGFWGEWWHQFLRRHCCSIGDAVVGICDSQWPIEYRKAVRCVVVFLLSGILHAFGSYTSAGSTTPWTSLIPFALQPIGILFEGMAARYLKLAAPKMADSSRWRTMGHLGFTLCWLVLTFSFLIDDLARSGIWLIEPLPFSVMRWMGMSAEKDNWNCWSGSWLSFHDGRSVWKSGFTVNGPR